MESALIRPNSEMMVRAMLRSALGWLGWFLMIAVVLPIGLGGAVSYARGWPQSWRSADWSSSGVLPAAGTVRQAKVIILAARTGNWKSIFAEHMAIVMKRAGDRDWTRYEVVGWGTPVRRNAYAADARWYGNRPYVVAEFSGDEAARLIPRIEQSIARYPHQQRGSYTVWPGPNSNTFVAWVVRNTDGLSAELPPVAVGKDYLDGGLGVGTAPSHTGFTVSAWGVIGATLAWREGLEINLLGTAIGIDPDDLAIKLPSIGKVSLWDLAA